MADPEIPRTRLEQLLRQRRMTVDEFRRRYCRLSATELSERQAYRWIAGELQGLPYPHAQAALEQLLGEPAPRLFGKPYGAGSPAPVRRQPIRESQRGSVRQDWQGQVVTMSAERARDFLNRAEESNVGSETIEQLADDVRRLAIAYQQQELESLLGDLVDVQDRAFGLLEGRQRPSQTQDLYMLAGVASGLMAKASHDLGASHDAMTQARAAYACADNSGHNGSPCLDSRPAVTDRVLGWSLRRLAAVRRVGRESHGRRAEHGRGVALRCPSPSLGSARTVRRS